jgi:hypothetical protein
MARTVDLHGAILAQFGADSPARFAKWRRAGLESSSASANGRGSRLDESARFRPNLVSCSKGLATMDKRPCDQCRLPFDPYAHRSMLPRLTRRWWQWGDELAVYTCPSCGAMHTMRISRAAMIAAIGALIAGAAAIVVLRTHVVAIASVASLAALAIARFGVRMNRIGEGRRARKSRISRLA